MKSIVPFIFFLTFFLFFSCQTGQADSAKKPKSSKAIAAAKEPAKKSNKKKILFFGDSLTAGYGLSPQEAFPGLIQNYIDSLSLNYRVINAGLSGETTASGLNRLDWVLKEEVAIFVLELGGNDGLRGLKLESTKNNLLGMIDFVSNKFPKTKIVLAGMEIPPSMGEDYTSAFRNMYTEISQERELIFIPFLLDGVGGVRSLNLPDGIHPTAEGHTIVAETVWSYLKVLL